MQVKMLSQMSVAAALMVTVVAMRVDSVEAYRVLPRESGDNVSLAEQQLNAAEIPQELILDSVIDLSSSVFNGQKEVKIGGKSYRCCSKSKGAVSILVHVEEVKARGMSWWAELNAAMGGATGCTQLVGKGYHSWSYWTGNRCQVLESALPEDLRDAPWIPQNRLHSVMDLSTLFIDPQSGEKYKDTKLPNSKSYRCCTKDAAHLGKIVDTTGPDKSGIFKSKCEHLAGDGYHSWPHWRDGSCLVDSQHVPKDLLNHLVSGSISVIPHQGGSHNGVNDGKQHGDSPAANRPANCAAGNEIKIRVVHATTAEVIQGVPVTVYIKDGSNDGDIVDALTQPTGMATFCLPTDATKIKVEPTRNDFMFYSRAYDLKRQCRPGHCTLQCALQENGN